MKPKPSPHFIIQLTCTFLLLGCILFSSTAWSKGSQPPRETLRFLPPHSQMIGHVNDINASIAEVMNIARRLGFEYPIQRELRKVWRRFHRAMKTSHVPKSWEDFFNQMGLPARPNITAAMIKDSNVPWKKKFPYGFLVVVPIHKEKSILRNVRDIHKSFIRQQVRSCFHLCRILYTRHKMTGKGPFTLKHLETSNKNYAKKCPQVFRYLQKGSKLNCAAQYSVRKKIVEQTRATQITKWGGTVYIYPGATIPFGIFQSFLLVGSSQDVLLQAFKRYSKQNAHPTAKGFAKRNNGRTHFQMMMSGSIMSEFSRLAQQDNQKEIRKIGSKNPSLRTMLALSQFMQKAINPVGIYKKTWMELHSSPTGFESTYLLHLAKRISTLYRNLFKVKPSHLKTLEFVPHNAWIVTGMNFLSSYAYLTQYLLRKSGAMGRRVRPLLTPWLRLIGKEATFSLAPGPQGSIRAMFMLQLKNKRMFQKQIRRLENALGGGGTTLFSTTIVKGVQIRHKFFAPKNKSLHNLPIAGIPRSAEVAFGVFKSTLFITAELTAKPGLSMFRELILSNGKVKSIYENPIFAQATKKHGVVNAVAFANLQGLLQFMSRILPPQPKTRFILRQLSILSHMFGYQRMFLSKRQSDAYGELRFTAGKKK